MEENRREECRKNNWKMEIVHKNLLRKEADNTHKSGYNQSDLSASVGIHYIHIISI